MADGWPRYRNLRVCWRTGPRRTKPWPEPKCWPCAFSRSVSSTARAAHTRSIFPSPQRLVHYRENWYLDTWCHLRNDLRSFSVDGIRRIEIVDTPAKDVALKTLDDYLLDSYGIVRGGEAQRAKLRFSVERARWVASEVWHPDQKGSFDAEGRYLLELPFRDDRELVLDILRHGAEVEVLSPLVLRRKVIAQLAEAARLYK